MDNCYVPASAIPVFLSLGLRGKPNLISFPTDDFLQYHPRRLDGSRDRPPSRQLRYNDVNAVLQIAQALGRHLCARQNHTERAEQCKFNILALHPLGGSLDKPPPPETPYLTVESYREKHEEAGGMKKMTTVHIIVAKIQESREDLWRIKEVVIKLGILCGTMENTARALESLDRDFAAIFTEDNPSLAFSFRIKVDRELFKEITTVVPDPLRLLEEKGKLIPELEEDMDDGDSDVIRL
ncbi:uncharacterized protein PHACADRAFT_184907 [Phanerochaete carnosa HHB-10118-sp]|uniref:Uncharacterized protein n=1 Tax=Phanerochaete carnosa (strain HHB-10118-sp) TaxID=650164 RepID=K5W425_PHACS|nr:uncharacterized protein PHACADRAFT_184907 [Phanerochaete carnosa HHB-10118-sp]EKM53865.1 hypothetical protein PHACADRAFT_184907 [Phanerochaete carnosa HHB-10118-sp]